MGTRYEMFDASRTAVELWSAELAEEQTGEQLDDGDVALSLADDEAAVLVGTPEALRAVAEKISRAVAEPPGELRTLTPGEVDDFLTCPDCGKELEVTVQEVDYRRGARWNAGAASTSGSPTRSRCSTSTSSARRDTGPSSFPTSMTTTEPGRPAAAPDRLRAGTPCRSSRRRYRT